MSHNGCFLYQFRGAAHSKYKIWRRKRSLLGTFTHVKKRRLTASTRNCQSILTGYKIQGNRQRFVKDFTLVKLQGAVSYLLDYSTNSSNRQRQSLNLKSENGKKSSIVLTCDNETLPFYHRVSLTRRPWRSPRRAAGTRSCRCPCSTVSRCRSHRHCRHWSESFEEFAIRSNFVVRRKKSPRDFSQYILKETFH